VIASHLFYFIPEIRDKFRDGTLRQWRIGWHNYNNTTGYEDPVLMLHR